MRRETNGRKKESFTRKTPHERNKWERTLFYSNLATVLQEKHLMRRETNGSKK